MSSYRQIKTCWTGCVSPLSVRICKYEDCKTPAGYILRFVWLRFQVVKIKNWQFYSHFSWFDDHKNTLFFYNKWLLLRSFYILAKSPSLSVSVALGKKQGICGKIEFF